MRSKAVEKIGKPFAAILAAGLILAAAAQADEGLNIAVSPNPIHEDENVQLSISVNLQDASNIGDPEFQAPDFDRVGGGSREIAYSSSFINGKISATQRAIFHYILFPKKSGMLKISDIRLQVDNRTLHSDGISVKVLPGSGGGQRQQLPPARRNQIFPSIPGFDDEEDEDIVNPMLTNPAGPNSFQSKGSTVNPKEAPERFNSDFTVHLSTDKKTAYVGEPITATYWLYDNCNIDIQGLQVTKWPTFNGFWKEDIEIATRIFLEPTYVGNRRMRRQMMGKFALYALKPGKLPIDKMIVQAPYLPRTCEDSGAFGGLLFGFGPARKGMHASQDMNVEILPLPEQGRPQHFSGAVGRFKIALLADKTNLMANSPLTLTLNIAGTGNFNAIEDIKLPTPLEFELYESNSGNNPSDKKAGTENRKTFTYIVLPRKSGKFTIPPVEWSYFDPEKKSYESLKTDPIAVEVTADPNASAQTASHGQGPSAGVSLSNQAPEKRAELGGLKGVEDILGDSGSRAGLLPLLAGLLAFAALGLAVFKLGRKVRIPSLAQRNPLSHWKKEISLLDEAKSRHELCSQAERLLYGLMDILLSSASRGMTRDDLENSWKEQALPPELLRRIESALDLCAREQYAPGAGTNIDDGLRKRLKEEICALGEKAAKIERK